MASVKELFNLSRETNGPEGTVSKKTQDSLTLLRKGMNGLIENISSINHSFVDLVELLTLMTTQVENLHAVSHFKHETFSALKYSQDFGTMVKESLKRITNWFEKYFTHDRSYYPVPDTSMPLSALSTMALPAVQRVTKEDEAVMKDYRPVRQRTVRSETTKDKAGALPPAVYFQAKQKEHSYVEFNREQAIPDDAATPTPITETTEQSEHSHGIDELQSVSLTFVNNLDVPEVQIQEIQQLDEYETDVDTESDEEGDFEVVSKTCTTRSRRAVRAFVRLDL